MRILQEVCSLLIKGSKTGPDAFTWYQMGVESHLRITNLYEYYMASVDLDAVLELPKVILMYFSFQSNLDYEHSAFLYAYLLKHRKDYEELYEHYEREWSGSSLTRSRSSILTDIWQYCIRNSCLRPL